MKRLARKACFEFRIRRYPSQLRGVMNSTRKEGILSSGGPIEEWIKVINNKPFDMGAKMILKKALPQRWAPKCGRNRAAEYKSLQY